MEEGEIPWLQYNEVNESSSDEGNEPANEFAQPEAFMLDGNNNLEDDSSVSEDLDVDWRCVAMLLHAVTHSVELPWELRLIVRLGFCRCRVRCHSLYGLCPSSQPAWTSRLTALILREKFERLLF